MKVVNPGTPYAHQGSSGLYLGLGPGPEENANGCSIKTERLAQLIFQVTFIAEMHGLGIIGEEDKGGWVHLCLRCIEQLQLFSPKSGRTIATDRFLYHFI